MKWLFKPRSGVNWLFKSFSKALPLLIKSNRPQNPNAKVVEQYQSKNKISN